MGMTSTDQQAQQPVSTPVVVTNNAKDSFIDSLSGYKTYIVAGLMVLYAISGFLLNDLSQAQAMTILLNALGIAGLRNGIQKGFESLIQL